MISIPFNFGFELSICLILSWVLSYFLRSIFNYYGLNKRIVLLILFWYTWVKIYSEACVITGHKIIHSAVLIPYSPNLGDMFKSAGLHKQVIQKFIVKDRNDIILLQDQCETFKSASSACGPNSVWSDIFREQIRSLEAEKIPQLKERSDLMEIAFSQYRTNILYAFGDKKSLKIDLNNAQIMLVP